MFTVKDILDVAIRLEENGEQVYRSALTHTTNGSLRELLAWSAGEEQKHAEWFSQLKADIDLSEDDHLISEMSRTLINDVVADQSFSLKDVDFSKIHNTEDLIDIFLEFEEDTILFFEMLQTFITNRDTLDRLEQITSEEKTHVRKLRTLRSNVPIREEG